MEKNDFNVKMFLFTLSFSWQMIWLLQGKLLPFRVAPVVSEIKYIIILE